MHTHSLVSSLSDDTMITRTKRLVLAERFATAEVVVHLAEIEARRLHLAEGCSSLFGYCTQVLHLSEYEAYTRIAAARAGRRFPLVFECLARGDVHLSAVDLLAPHLTEENHVELLGWARHRTKREVERIVAEVAPRPAVGAMVRRLPARTSAEAGKAVGAAGAAGVAGVPGAANVAGPAGAADAAGTAGIAGNAEATNAGPELLMPDGTTNSIVAQVEGPPAPRSARPRVEALSPERYRIQFTGDPETVELLRRAQDLLRHQVPDGDPAAVFKKALRVLVKDLEKTKAALVERPRGRRDLGSGVGDESRSSKKEKTKDDTAASPRRDPRTIPAAVRRLVWTRDRGRCAFHSRNHHRCTETGGLEFHHVKPFALGGPATADNIELRCRAHNQYEAVQVFGDRSASMVREKRPPDWVRAQLEAGGMRDGLRPRTLERKFESRETPSKWDGRDRTGRAAPPGIHFLRLVLDGTPVDTKKIVRIRWHPERGVTFGTTP